MQTTQRPVRARFLSPVHVFDYRGEPYTFFVQMSRMTRLEPAAAAALREVEAGRYHADRDAVGQLLLGRFGSEVRDRVMADLSVLECTGFVAGDLAELSAAERDKDIRGLMDHQPRNLMFFVTEACNLACTYCYEKNQGVHDKPSMMQRQDARRIIDRYLAESPDRRGVSITFFGGEPLLNPRLIEDTVAYAKEQAAASGKSIGFTMTSNLTLLTPEMAEFLAREKFHVMVSLDGDREANDRYRVMRDGSGTYDRVVANLQVLIAAMKRHGTRLPKIRATMTAENRDALAVERHLRSLGTHLVEVGESHGTVSGQQHFDVRSEGGTTSGSIEAHIDAVLQGLARGGKVPRLARAVREGLQRVHESLNQPTAHGPARPKLCGVWRNMKAVTPKGDLFPCHRYVGMDAFRFGNIHERGVDQQRLADYYDQVYDAFAAACAPCWLRYLCGGQCPWYLSHADGSIHPPDEAMCNTLRKGHERSLGLYALLASEHPHVLAAVLDVPAASDSAAGPTALPHNAPDDSCGT